MSKKINSLIADTNTPTDFSSIPAAHGYLNKQQKNKQSFNINVCLHQVDDLCAP